MSIFGKVLIFINLLAAAAFVYFATADWSEREKWSYAVYRQDLALDGLPLDTEELGPDGAPAVNRLTDQTLVDMFRQVGGGLPSPLTLEDKTQIGAVKRVRDKLRGEIEALGGDPQKVQDKVSALLIPLASTVGEREQLWQELRKDPKGQFEKAFQDVLDSGNRPPEVRRTTIAHLLLNLTANADPQQFTTEFQRVQVIVGLKEFAAEADRQFYALRDMAKDYTLALGEDRAIFEQAYSRQLGYLYQLAQELNLKQQKLAEYEQLAKQHQALANARKTDLRELTDQLEAARRATQKALNDLATEQQRLFEAERKVATSAEKNQKLERQIRDLEQVKP